MWIAFSPGVREILESKWTLVALALVVTPHESIWANMQLRLGGDSARNDSARNHR